MATYDALIEISEVDQTARLASGGHPGFYWTSNGTAPQGAPYMDEDLIVKNKVRMAKNYTGWTSTNFDENSEHGQALTLLDIPTARLTHQKNETIHFVMPRIGFYPLMTTWMGAGDIKNIDKGEYRMKQRGYDRPGKRCGIGYAWRDTEYDGKKSSTTHVMVLGVPRFMLRGTEGLFSDSPGMTPETGNPLPFQFGDKGQKGTEFFFKALCAGQAIGMELFKQRKHIYEYWTALYEQSDMDLEPIERLKEWLESAASRGAKNLPPSWVLHVIGQSPTMYTAGQGDLVTQKYGTWPYMPDLDNLDALLSHVALPYEIEPLVSMVPEAVAWSESVSTLHTGKQDTDKAI